MGLYEQLFEQIVTHINAQLSFASNYSIGILDIAGFGKCKNLFNYFYLLYILFFFSEYLTEGYNTFDQLCINYTNERMQNFFIKIMLAKEKEWYNSQSLDVPFVQFLDNAHIIGNPTYVT